MAANIVVIIVAAIIVAANVATVGVAVIITMAVIMADGVGVIIVTVEVAADGVAAIMRARIAGISTAVIVMANISGQPYLRHRDG